MGSEQPAGGTPAGDVSRETPDTSGTEADRLDQLTAKVDSLAEAVSRLVPGSHAEAQQRTGDRLDRPSGIEAQVRAELQRAQAEQAAAAARDQAAAAATSQQQTMAQRLAALEEKPPAPPVPRRTKFLGWGTP